MIKVYVLIGEDQLRMVMFQMRQLVQELRLVVIVNKSQNGGCLASFLPSFLREVFSDVIPNRF